jgi:phage FluMu protein Com
MQLRCTYCQTMFALSREEMLAAMEHMEENNQIYYEAHCPKCRRGNRVERTRMERFFPDWKNAIKTMSKESAKVEIAVEKQPITTGAVKAEAAPKAHARHEKKHPPKTKAAGAAALKPAMKISSQKGKPAGNKKK